MATTRTVHAEQDGPVNIRFKSNSFGLTVIAEEGRTRGEIRVSTADDEGSSADLVKAINLDASGTTLTLDASEAGGGITVVNSGGYGSVHVSQNFGVVAGDVTGMVVTGRGGVVIGNGVTMVNGRVINAGGGDVVVVKGGSSPITVTAYVPAGSSVSGSTQRGGIETRGRLDQVGFSSQSGGADLDEVNNVTFQTQSGSIAIANLTGMAMLNTRSGSIDVHGGPGARATARTMSGNVRGTGGLDLDGSSMSGSVRSR